MVKLKTWLMQQPFFWLNRGKVETQALNFAVVGFLLIFHKIKHVWETWYVHGWGKKYISSAALDVIDSVKASRGAGRADFLSILSQCCPFLASLL